MPVATPTQFAAMLDAAQQGSYAYPAINCTSIQTINAALKAFAVMDVSSPLTGSNVVPITSTPTRASSRPVAANTDDLSGATRARPLDEDEEMNPDPQPDQQDF